MFLGELSKQLVDSKAKVVFCTPQNVDSILRAIQELNTVKLILVVYPKNISRRQFCRSSESRCEIIDFSEALNFEPILDQTDRSTTHSDHNDDILILPYSRYSNNPEKRYKKKFIVERLDRQKV